MSILPNEFYPTPPALAERMLKSIDLTEVRSVLEPSAGKGDLLVQLHRFEEETPYWHFNRWHITDIDVCEAETSFRPLLMEKGWHFVSSDFLTYSTLKQYDLILMNPPFSNGDAHLMKAIHMMRNGGQIACILNAETLKNPFSLKRKELLHKLEEYKASVEYIEKAFYNAERKTDVEIALIYINIPRSFEDSDILNNLREARERDEQSIPEETQLSSSIEEYIKGIVKQYEFECEAGIKLISEYRNISRKVLDSFKENAGQILELKVHTFSEDNHSYKSIENLYLEKVRYKYWEALFSNKEFQNAMTTKLSEEYHSKLMEMRFYEFNLENIYQIRMDLSKRLTASVEDEIMRIFDDFARQYSYYPECDKNIIHYYNGWSTNKCGIINKKVIVPHQAYDVCWRMEFRPNEYVTIRYFADIEKVFNYLDGGLSKDFESVNKILDNARAEGKTKGVEFKYFTVDFFKKGTCHIRFKNLDLLKKLNIFAGRKLNALPPSYGKKSYADMSEREKTIIDDFEGKDAYETTYNNAAYFITDASQMLMLELSD